MPRVRKRRSKSGRLQLWIALHSGRFSIAKATLQAAEFQHVLCVYPYRRELRQAGFCPPLGLEFIAAALRPYAHALDVIDLRKETRNAKDFLRPETDLVCYSVNWDLEAEFVRGQIASIPPHICTIVGGRHATENPERWLADLPGVRMVVRGDGEEAITEFCHGRPLEQIAGISYRAQGRVVHAPVRKCGLLHDDLYPDRSARRYSYTLHDTGLAFDTIASSRGCPYNCTFCSFGRNPLGGRRAWVARSPESVVRELSEVAAPIVGFTDDNFAFDMDRVSGICDLILAQGIRKKYVINARLEIAQRPEVLAKMKQAGFAALLLGLESAHDKTLKSMRKGFDTAKIHEHFKVLRASGMFLHGSFIVGNVGETEAEMLQIAPFAHELGLDTVGLSALRSSPYSGLEELLAECPDYHIASSGKVFSDQLSVHDLTRLRRRIANEFYTPGQIVRAVRKGIGNGLLTHIPGLLLGLPRFMWQRMRHARRRKQHERRLQAIASAPGGSLRA